MANKPYENYVLANEIEDQFNSHLDLMQFVTVDRSLAGTAGMKKIINVYSATDGTQKLTQGQGNTKSIEATYTQREYNINLAQNRFIYFDEELMKDPLLIQTGTRHMGTDMFNTTNADIYAEFNKATLVSNPDTLNFDAVVDAVALLNMEDLEDQTLFGWLNPKDVAKFRKAMKDTLQYVEAFARTGYIGTVAGVNFYTKKDAIEGTIIIATKEAVTYFVKTGTEVEQTTKGNRSADDENIRKNTIFSRKYYVVALTDETKVVKMQIGKVATLKALTIGDLPLQPTFNEGVYTYTATTTNATDNITATATDSGATVSILNGESPVTSGSAATWTAGANTVKITVKNGTAECVYTVTVTYNEG